MSDSKVEQKDPNSFKMVFIGSAAVGSKSALISRFISGCFIEEFDPTIEDSYKTTITVDGKQYCIFILDTAGQEDYSAMTDQYFKYADIIVLAFSITSRDSFREAAKLLRKAATFDKKLMIAVGGKSDLADMREVPTEEARSFFENWNPPVQYIEASAKTGDNVTKVFEEAARLWAFANNSTENENSDDRKKKCIIC